MSLFSKLFNPEQNGSEKKKKKSDIIPKLCCLFCALGLWLLVSGQTDIQDEKTYNGVPVKIENSDILSEQSGLSIISGDDYIINITVRGNRSKLASYDSSAITAKVDVSKITEAGVHSLDVVVVPPSSSGFSVVEQSLSKIEVNVDKRTDVKLDVSVNVVSSLQDSDYYFDTTVNPSEVTVSGPQKLLRSIHSAGVELDLGTITKDVNFNSRIILRDKNGKEIVSPYITLSEQYAEGSIHLMGNDEANETIEKIVPVVCDYRYGYYNDTNCSYSVYPPNVTIKGTKKDLAKIDKIKVHTIDETEITSSTALRVTVDSPKGTVLVGDKTVIVTVTVSESISSREVVMNTADFTQLSDSLSAEIDGAYIIKLFGETAALARIQEMIELHETVGGEEHPHPVKAYVDMSLIREAGVYSLPVTVVFDSDEFENKVWCEATNIGVKVS